MARQKQEEAWLKADQDKVTAEIEKNKNGKPRQHEEIREPVSCRESSQRTGDEEASYIICRSGTIRPTRKLTVLTLNTLWRKD